MNYQNIPRDLKVVKRAFISKFEGGALSYFDYKQIEPRLLAYFLAKIGDHELADKLNIGWDPYTVIVSGIYGKVPGELTETERQTGKVLFLSLMYGGGVTTVKKQFDVNYPTAKSMIRQFHDAWPGVRRLQDLTVETAQRRGHIKTPWGRHLHLEEYGEHKFLNKLIQGTAADVMKAALIQVGPFLRDAGAQTHMISQVHDEIQFDGPRHELEFLHLEIPGLMCRKDPIMAEIGSVVPIEVEHEVSFTSWADKAPYEEVICPTPAG